MASLARLATRQHGVITHGQLLGLGFSSSAIGRMVGSGHVYRIHRGVYIVGHLATHAYAYETAAILACAPQAMLRHPTATRLWELPLPAPTSSDIHVTVVGRNLRDRPGIKIDSISSIDETDVRRLHGLPLTSPALTLLDLAGTQSERDLRRALNEARVQRLVTDKALLATADRHAWRKGSAAIRETLRSEEGCFSTESEAEALCLRLMIKHGIPPDETQGRVGPYRVDFLYRRERLVVEVDGYRYHSTHGRFVDDRRKATGLAALGYLLYPLTWADLTGSVDETMSRLADVLRLRRRNEA